MGSDKQFHQNRKQYARDIERRKEKKAAYETVLIVCEGEKTEVNYFDSLRKAYRLNTANVVIMPSEKGSAPISVVDYAIEVGSSTFGIDKVFCVFDRDEHNSYYQALDKINHYKLKRNAINKPKYKAIISSPCFELWLLLHFTFTTKNFSKTGNKSASENLIAELRKYLPEYAKNEKNLFLQINRHTEVAIKNAKHLKIENEKAGISEPFTDVFELVDFLVNLKN